MSVGDFIPKKKFYVTMTDRALSGWGHAEGKTNKFVIGCDTWERADFLAHAAGRRSEMKYINITTKNHIGAIMFM